MGTDILQVAITTLASGGLAAIGAYIGVIWKLSSRVAKLEETVGVLKHEQEDIKMDQAAIKKDLSEQMARIYASQEEAKREIITSIGMLQRETADFRVTCSDNRSAMVRKREFAGFTEEQERRWSEFYRLVGRLEGAMDRLSKRPPALIQPSKSS